MNLPHLSLGSEGGGKQLQQPTQTCGSLFLFTFV